MSKLYVVMGIPGAGKSTWIREHFHPMWDKHISRDEIRFGLVPEDAGYFSKEKEVFKEFSQAINAAIEEDEGDVYADATHLNAKSRRKLLKSITSYPDSIECIWIKTPLDECLRRNEERRGSRSYVPSDQIRSMYKRLTQPSFEEGFNTIYIVEPDKPIQIIKEKKDAADLDHKRHSSKS